MSRTSRDNMRNSSFFHIMVQGINKECIFEKSKDKERYLKLIEKNSEGVEIIAYCIMSNHAHILAQVDDISELETFMRKTNTSYAAYYNRKNERVGYVFRDRYKLQPIKNIKHLYLCVEYIHNNPVKACICKTKEEYRFSSYAKIYEKDTKNIKNKLERLLNIKMNQMEDATNIGMSQEEDATSVEMSQMQIENIQEQYQEFKLIEDEKEDKNQICENTINQFLQIKNLHIKCIKKDDKELAELVKILHNANGISYKTIEKYLKISREKLRRLNTIK